MTRPCPARCANGESVISGDPQNPATREDMGGANLVTRPCAVCDGSVEVSPAVVTAYRTDGPAAAAAQHYTDTHPEDR